MLSVIPAQITHDQFYTQPEVSAFCVKETLSWLKARYLDPRACRFVEPAAGTGSFLIPLRQQNLWVEAFDIDPAAPGIRSADFLSDPSLIPIRSDLYTITIGNPPFGRNANQAKRFFNQAARFSEAIAFILPRTFRKESIHHQLDLNFHLSPVDLTLPRRAFWGRGEPYEVPTCFQIWERQTTPRQIRPTPEVGHLIQFCHPAEADLALRRVGGRTGEVLPGTNHSPTTTYFIRLVSRPDEIRTFLQGYDWSSIRDNTAGVRSLSKRELAQALASRFGPPPQEMLVTDK